MIFTNGNIKKLEELLKFKNGTIGKAIDRKSIIKPATIDKILEIFPSINKNWLLTGEGQPLKDDIVKININYRQQAIDVIELQASVDVLLNYVFKLRMKLENMSIDAVDAEYEKDLRIQLRQLKRSQ